jgi:hypothetical protein
VELLRVSTRDSDREDVGVFRVRGAEKEYFEARIFV